MRYLTSDLAKLLGVTTNTIRRYEKCGFLSPGRDSANYRYYEDFDIIKTSIIRLYLKCGFTHNELNSMLNTSTENILNKCNKKIESLDEQIERLYRLRHWLKDNIVLLNTLEDLKDDYIFKVCPALKYVAFKSGNNLLTEKDRLSLINYFMYQAPEVQFINIYKLEDINENRFIPYTCWAINEANIEKFRMSEIVSQNKYVEYYPSQNCFYGIIEMPVSDMYNQNKFDDASKEYLIKAKKYLSENGYEICGDMIHFYINGFGNTIGIIVCLPIKEIG